VPPGRVQQVVDKLEGGVTSETCSVSYRGYGAPAAPVEPERGRSRKRQCRGKPAAWASASVSRSEGGARSRKSATTPLSSQQSARAMSEVASSTMSTPAPVHPSQRFSLEQLLAHQNYGAYVPTFCPPPPNPGAVDFLRAGGVVPRVSRVSSGGGTPAVAAVGNGRAGVTRQ
jgi:hypothetical protein